MSSRHGAARECAVPSRARAAACSSGRAGPERAGLGRGQAVRRERCAFRRWRRLRALQDAATREAGTRQPTDRERADVLRSLSAIIDPDLGKNIVECGFVQDIVVEDKVGEGSEADVTITLQLTTPACPVKEEFRVQASDLVGKLEWTDQVGVEISSSALPDERAGLGLPVGLRGVRHIIAVSSCKGGVGKSSVAVNLAYSLRMMGAKVGIFDADVYGPSLPIMVSPKENILEMDPETKQITPCEYEGVKLVSFGFTAQGSAIMRGPMVSGLVEQLLTTSNWGDLDYLIMDFPPGTGDIQLTIGQAVPIAAAVIVTTPQKLAFTDVAKGIRMFAKLQVPCVSIVENMSYFDAAGQRHFPFGKGSGDRIQREFSVPALIRLPITPEVSHAGDSGVPCVVSDPAGEVSRQMGELGAHVVKEVAKMSKGDRPSAKYDEQSGSILLSLPAVAGEGGGGEREELVLTPENVRRHDKSAKAVQEWAGTPSEPDIDGSDLQNLKPENISPLGNYAVQITWSDGFNQVAPFEQLIELAYEERAAA